MKNYYDELEVNKNASAEVINRAYKVLAKKYHPDTTTENKQFAEERFKKISEAYEVLSNQQKREEYDRTLGPEIDSNKYNKVLEDNKTLSRELLNLKSQLDNMNSNKTSQTNYYNRPSPGTSNTNSYNRPNQNINYNQPNSNQNYNYYTTQRPQNRKKYSLLDEFIFKLKELGKKIFAITLTALIIIITLGLLYIIPPTRNFLIHDLQLGFLFSIFK